MQKCVKETTQKDNGRWMRHEDMCSQKRQADRQQREVGRQTGKKTKKNRERHTIIK